MDLVPSGFNLFLNMKNKTLESRVFADSEKMFVCVLSMQDMLYIFFFFKERLKAWVKNCDKCGNINDDYIAQQTFFCL